MRNDSAIDADASNGDPLAFALCVVLLFALCACTCACTHQDKLEDLCARVWWGPRGSFALRESFAITDDDTDDDDAT